MYQVKGDTGLVTLTITLMTYIGLRGIIKQGYVKKAPIAEQFIPQDHISRLGLYITYQ